MTPESLINRAGLSFNTTAEKHTELKASELDRRLHQYRSKLLSATRTPAAKNTTSNRDSIADSENLSEPIDKNKTSRQEDKSRSPDDVSRNDIREESSVRELSRKFADDNSRDNEALSSGETKAASTVIENNDDSSESVDAVTLNGDTHEQIQDENHPAEETNSALNILTTFHPLHLLQQNSDAGTNTLTEEKPITAPQGLTRLFSRFDKTSNTATLNETASFSNLNETEQPATIPTGFAKFLNFSFSNNGSGNRQNAAVSTKIESELGIQQPEIPLDVPAIPTLESAVQLTVPELNIPTEVQDEDESGSVSDELIQTDVETAAVPLDVQPVLIQSVVIHNEPTIKKNEDSSQENSVEEAVSPRIEEKTVHGNSIAENMETALENVSDKPSNNKVKEQPEAVENFSQVVIEKPSDIVKEKEPSTSDLDPVIHQGQLPETKTTAGGQVIQSEGIKHQVKELVEQVRHLFSHLTEGPQTIRVRLNPPELGMLQLDIQKTDQGIVAVIQTETAQTHKLLQEGLQQLKESLMIQGQNLFSIQIELSPDLGKEADSSDEESRREQQQSQEDQSQGQSQQRENEQQQKQRRFRSEYLTEMDVEI